MVDSDRGGRTKGKSGTEMKVCSICGGFTGGFEEMYTSDSSCLYFTKARVEEAMFY